MERLASMDVKHIAGFLEFKDVVNFSQTRQPFQADLKPLIRKAEVAMMKENGKLKKVVTFMTRALIHIDEVARDDEDDGTDADECRNVVVVISDMVWRKFGDFFELDTRPKIHKTYDVNDIYRQGSTPLTHFDGSPEEDEAIIQHFMHYRNKHITVAVQPGQPVRG